MRAKKSVLSLAVTLAMTTGLALSTQAHAQQEQTEQQAEQNNNDQFEKIVVAAGVWSNVLAKTIGDDFPLDTERGHHIIFENNV